MKGTLARRGRPRGILYFCAAAFLMLLVAWNTGNNLQYILFASLAGIIGMSLLLSRNVLAGLSAERSAPGAVHRDVSFPVAIRVRNIRRWFPVPMLRIECPGRPEPVAGLTLSLPPGGEMVIRMHERFARRGVHPLPPVEAVSGFPFGLQERRRRIGDAQEVVVYPRVRAVRPAFLEQLRSTGHVPRVTRGAGDEFFSLREYQPGDDLRLVAWRMSARVGKLMVRELERSAGRFVACVLDTRLPGDPAFYDEPFEEAVELAASIAITLLNRNFGVTVMIPGETLPLGEGAAHRVRVLEMLARVNPSQASDPDPFLNAPGEHEGHRFHYVCLSADPARQGSPVPNLGTRVLTPAEVVHV
jgi:uncharacterized protein (DUF58 family)